MTRALDLPQKQIVALCKAAKKAGYVPEFRVGKTTIRLVPEEHAVRPQDQGPIDDTRSPETFETLDEYRAWRERKRAREDQGHP